SERAGGGRIGKVNDVHAAAGRVTIIEQGRAAGDHLRLIPVHVGPMLFQQFVAQRHRAGPVAVVAEELHAPVLTLVTPQVMGITCRTGSGRGPARRRSGWSAPGCWPDATARCGPASRKMSYSN